MEDVMQTDSTLLLTETISLVTQTARRRLPIFLNERLALFRRRMFVRFAPKAMQFAKVQRNFANP
jgi:hypothetical protein